MPTDTPGSLFYSLVAILDSVYGTQEQTQVQLQTQITAVFNQYGAATRQAFDPNVLMGYVLNNYNTSGDYPVVYDFMYITLITTNPHYDFAAFAVVVSDISPYICYRVMSDQNIVLSIEQQQRVKTHVHELCVQMEAQHKDIPTYLISIL
jgi:hypothetical protein